MDFDIKQVKPGHCVKLKNSFLRKYFPEVNGNFINHGKGRPYFFVCDEENDLFWVVPVSSDSEGKLRKRMIAYKNRESKHYPNWCQLGHINGKENIFKLSGMFPVPKSEVEDFFKGENGTTQVIPFQEQKWLLKKCLEYKEQNEENLKFGYKEIIKSPYKEILRDYYKAKDLEKSNVNLKPSDPEHEDPEVSDDDLEL